MGMAVAGIPTRRTALRISASGAQAVAHLLFLPAFVVLAHPSWLPTSLQDDAVSVLLVAALGLCTGYIGCMALVLGAEQGRTPEEKEVVGQVTSFGLMVGLSAGSISGVFIAHYLI